MTDNGFGRRGTPSQPNTASRRPSRPGPSPALSMPISNETAAKPLAINRSVVLAVVGALLFVVGAFGGRELSRQLFTMAAASKVEATLSDLQKNAIARYPGMSPVEAYAKYAADTAPDFANAAPSNRKVLLKAASTFFGFYHVNTRSRVEHCKQQGVDISAFVSRFEYYHRKEYTRALAIAEQAGMAEEQLWRIVRSSLTSLVRQDMDSVASKLGTSPQQACGAMLQHADKMLDYLDFSSRLPAVHRTLMGS